MEKKNKHYTILPYDLRVEIWNHIDQGVSTPEIIEKLYSRAPENVSESLFESCIQVIRTRHTLGQMPSKS
jgi:hypothetical protein